MAATKSLINARIIILEVLTHGHVLMDVRLRHRLGTLAEDHRGWRGIDGSGWLLLHLNIWS